MHLKDRFNLAKQYISGKYYIYKEKTLVFVDKRPLASFFVLLGLIVLLIIVSNIINKPEVVPVSTRTEAKEVTTYRVGSAPKITVQAQTKKTGVIQIVSLTSGVVQKLHVKEGDSVQKGQSLVSLSSNYQGGNALSLQRQLAATQYQNSVDTYPTQKEIIGKQKELAKKTDDNSDELRAITARSLDETRALITLNEQILTKLDQDIATLQATPGNDALILATRQIKSQFLAATNAARASLRSAEYSAASDKPGAQMSDLQKDIALKQLDIQEKQLDLNKEVSRIQLQIARVNEGLMYPVAPFRGTIQRVFVKEKTAVSPGTPFLIISQAIEEDPISAVAFVSKDIAQRVSVLEPSVLHLGNVAYEVSPSFISTEAVEGTLYAIYYPIPDSLNNHVVSEGFITVDIPLGYFDTSAIVSFVPLDAVYQTRSEAYIFTVQNGKAKAKKVMLGQVMGRFVEVQNGIMNGDEIILSRTVLDGDVVTPVAK